MHRKWTLLGGLTCALLAGALGGPLPAGVAQVAGPAQRLTDRWESARLVALKADGSQLTLEVDGEPTAVGWDELAWWGRWQDTRKGPQVLLDDGSLLVADLLALNAGRARLGVDWNRLGGTSLWEESTLPRRMVAAIIYRPPATAEQRDRLTRELLDASPEQDQVLLENGDTLAGELTTGGGPALPAAQPDQPSPPLMLRVSSKLVELPMERVTAVRLAGTAPQRAAATQFHLGFRDGSLLAADQLRRDGEMWELTRRGVTLRIGAETLRKQLCYFRPPNPRVVYLSDLEVLGYRHIPFLERAWDYGVDRDVLGGRLRLNQTVVPKGLGMHSTSRLAFELPASASRFQAEIALAEHCGRQGSCQFRVFVQGPNGQWSPAYSSPIIRGGDEAQSIDLPLNGARRLALIVDFADRGDVCDHANWLAARVVLSP